MKLVIEYQPWIEEKPYGCFWADNEGRRVPQPVYRDATEEGARKWCEARIKGKRVAEYEVPDGS